MRVVFEAGCMWGGSCVPRRTQMCPTSHDSPLALGQPEGPLGSEMSGLDPSPEETKA